MARRQIETCGVKGFKSHPSTQSFFPNDRAAYQVYEVIEEAGLPALFHTGQTGAGAGTRGGGIRLAYSNPMHLDDVAADFLDMPIILAHPSFPWQEEALSVATHKPQVYIDLSGWSPKYFAPSSSSREHAAQGQGPVRHRLPRAHPGAVDGRPGKIAIRDEIKPGLFKNNAARLLGLAK
jgi:predicted TIM-barrel fold metal-dependent hydrolase